MVENHHEMTSCIKFCKADHCARGVKNCQNFVTLFMDDPLSPDVNASSLLEYHKKLQIANVLTEFFTTSSRSNL